MITTKRKIYLLENIKNVIINTGEEYEWLIMMRKELWEYKTMMCSNSKYEVNLYVKIEELYKELYDERDKKLEELLVELPEQSSGVK